MSRRSYKEPMSHAYATRMIVDGRGHHFDPEVVDAFASVHDDFLKFAAAWTSH